MTFFQEKQQVSCPVCNHNILEADLECSHCKWLVENDAPTPRLSVVAEPLGGFAESKVEPSITAKTLTAEQTIYEAKPHKIMFLWPSVLAGWLGLMLASPGIGLMFFMGSQASNATFLVGAMFFLAGLCVPSLIWWIAKKTYETSTFVITDRRVIIKTGFLSKRQCQMNINKIEGVDTSQTLFERMIDCGSVTIRGTSGTKEVFGRIADPAAFQDHLQSQLDVMMAA